MSSNEKVAIAEAYRRLFLDEFGVLKPHARIVLEDLMRASNFFDDPKAGQGSFSDALIILEGSRSIVRRLLRYSGAGDQMLKRLLEGDKDG